MYSNAVPWSLQTPAALAHLDATNERPNNVSISLFWSFRSEHE